MTNMYEDDINKIKKEIMKPLIDGVKSGKYTVFAEVIRSDDRQNYADFFKQNFIFAVRELKEGKILALDTKLIQSTCWVGPGKDMIDNPAAAINPMLKGTKISRNSAESDYAEKLTSAIKESKITSAEVSSKYQSNGVDIWNTTQKERDDMMSALPLSVRYFSYGDFGDFTNKDLQNLVELMNRIPNIEVHLGFSTYGNPRIGPFDDKTYNDFVNAAKKSNGIYLDDAGYMHNPLFVQDGIFLEERLLRLEQAVGAKAIKTTLESCVIDRNYFLKKTQLQRGKTY